MNEVVFYIATRVLLVVGVITIITTLKVLQASRPERLLKPAPDVLPDDSPACASVDQWARAHGFQWSGACRFDLLAVRGWANPHEARFFIVYFAGPKVFCDLVTYFRDDTALTTCNSRDAFFLPSRPGSYKQAFPDKGLDDLWKLHCEAEAYFRENFGRNISPASQGFSETMIKALTRQMQHVRSLRLWPLRSVWWYCVNRFTKPNRPARELYPAARR